MRSSIFVVLCAVAMVKLSSGAQSASVFSQHSLEKRQAEEKVFLEFVDGKYKDYPELTFEQSFTYIQTVINQTDFEQCYPRLLCEMASSEQGYEHFRYLLEMFGGPFDEEIKKMSTLLQEFSTNLKEHIKVGKSLKSVEECRAKYYCDFTGEQMELQAKSLGQPLVTLLPVKGVA